MKAEKRVKRYVKIGKSQNFKLQGYSNNDWVGSDDNMKDNSGYCFSLGSRCFSWFSKNKGTLPKFTLDDDVGKKNDEELHTR